jgi:L-ascorbate metabolism protein UlaG (beta-lactamase superfamily)
LPPIDTALITHNHYDHLDARTIARLPRKDRIDVVAPLGLGGFFGGAGFASVGELDWYDSFRTGDLEITSVPAIHWSKRGLRDECRSLWCGYVLSSPSFRVYYSGDTGFGEIFNEIGTRLGGFDLGLAGIGAYEPRSVMRASHATPEEAAALLRAVRARSVLGMHWGSIVLSDENPFEPPVRFQAAARREGYDNDCVLQPRIGETLALTRRGLSLPTALE